MTEFPQLSATLPADQWDKIAEMLTEKCTNAQKEFNVYAPIINALRPQLQAKPPQPQNGAPSAGATPPLQAVSPQPG